MIFAGFILGRIRKADVKRIFFTRAVYILILK